MGRVYRQNLFCAYGVIWRYLKECNVSMTHGNIFEFILSEIAEEYTNSSVKFCRSVTISLKFIVFNIPFALNYGAKNFKEIIYGSTTHQHNVSVYGVVDRNKRLVDNSNY